MTDESLDTIVSQTEAALDKEQGAKPVRRRRTTRRSTKDLSENESTKTDALESQLAQDEPVKVRKTRRRTSVSAEDRKANTQEALVAELEDQSTQGKTRTRSTRKSLRERTLASGTDEQIEAPKRRRGRPRKSETATVSNSNVVDAKAESSAKVEAVDTNELQLSVEKASTQIPLFSEHTSHRDATEPADVIAPHSEFETKSDSAITRELDLNKERLDAQDSVAQNSDVQNTNVQDSVAQDSDAQEQLAALMPKPANEQEHTNELVHTTETYAPSKHEPKVETERSQNNERGRERDRERSHTSRSYDQQNSRNGRNQKRRSRRNQQEIIVEPSLSKEELSEMKVAELRAKAQELEIEYAGVRKKDLVEAIYEAAARAEGFRPAVGVLDFQPEGYAFVRSGNYMQGESDAFVHQQIIRQYGLRPGDWICGAVTPARNSNSKFPPLHKIDTINGRPAEEMKHRPRFRDLTPIYPNERLVMEHGKDSITGRAIDLVAPIGKGQRGLIVSPPKAGKTTILKKICQSISANNPEVHLFCLLVDERPEEVTDMERSIKGVVVASTFDMPASNHTSVAELVIEHAKRLVELGEDVVVVLDSITRLARAYNLAAPASGRILSGGVDSAALYPPKKFLGAARNIENGGSLTILASALVDTGSKMDEVIFEEFKGTGNMELKLDRDLADRRIFPAIDPVSSGTRNEDLLIDAELQPFVWGVRRILANMNSNERAATALVKGLKGTNNNEDFLVRSAKKAQQSEYVTA